MNNTEYRPMTIGNWIVTLILLAIPLVNIIMMIVWAVSETTYPSRKTYAQASLILMAIGVVIAIVFVILAAMFGLSAARMQ